MVLTEEEHYLCQKTSNTSLHVTAYIDNEAINERSVIGFNYDMRLVYFIINLTPGFA